MIAVQCPSCDRKFNVGAALAGKTFTCPNCQEEVPVPAAGGGAGLWLALLALNLLLTAALAVCYYLVEMKR